MATNTVQSKEVSQTVEEDQAQVHAFRDDGTIMAAMGKKQQLNVSFEFFTRRGCGHDSPALVLTSERGVRRVILSSALPISLLLDDI